MQGRIAATLDRAYRHTYMYSTLLYVGTLYACRVHTLHTTTTTDVNVSHHALENKYFSLCLSLSVCFSLSLSVSLLSPRYDIYIL